ncbi:MAG: hypothetical protein GY804_01445 [Alphaproteobacteria bacterium]|nr:hypothetical protein [Alphaproteobacteria bacterium]
MSNIEILNLFQSEINPDWFTIRKSLLKKAKKKRSLSFEELITLRACEAVIDNDRHAARMVKRKATTSPPNNHLEIHPRKKSKALLSIYNAMEKSLKLKRRR